MIGQSAKEILRCDMSLEDKAVADLREAIPYCESVRDFVSRDLFSGILRDEEDHIDFIETQFDLIKRIGAENWMQLNSDAAD
jgi:bacterioferritin